MKVISKLPLFLIFAGLLVIVGLKTSQLSYAETNLIVIGNWEFDEADFADYITVLDSVKRIDVIGVDNCSGTELELGAAQFQTCLNLALAGYSPETLLANVGTPQDTGSNWFQADFTDVIAENHFGPDLVLFECHFPGNNNSYEIAVHVEDEPDFTNFISYDSAEFQNTDSVCADPNTNLGLLIDLADFDIPSGASVDAIQFKVIDPDPGDPNVHPQGEPSMIAVLSHSPVIPAIHLPLIFKP